MALPLAAYAGRSPGSPMMRPSTLRHRQHAAAPYFPVISKLLPSAFDCHSVLHGRVINFSPRVCGLKLWIIQKLKHRKDIDQHGWEKKRSDQNHHLEIKLSSERKPIEDQPLPNDISEDMLSTISQATESSPSSYQPVAPEDLKAPVGPPSSLLEASSYAYDHPVDKAPSLCIAVIGATGELARNKVFPALFALYYSGFLPENVGIIGYSRKQLTDEDLRSIISGTLTCRVDHHENCGDKLGAFLNRTYHLNGGYNNTDGMAKLNSRMEQIEGYHEANRIFYLSVPQEALLDVALSLADGAQTKRGWNRIIIEKPFGFDAVSSYQLTRFLLSKFEEKQIYRIDHLLGKDLIENLTVLRFSNLVFEPLWSRTYIRNVQVIFSEECGVESRGRRSSRVQHCTSCGFECFLST